MNQLRQETYFNLFSCVVDSSRVEFYDELIFRFNAVVFESEDFNLENNNVKTIPLITYTACFSELDIEDEYLEKFYEEKNLNNFNIGKWLFDKVMELEKSLQQLNCYLNIFKTNNLPLFIKNQLSDHLYITGFKRGNFYNLDEIVKIVSNFYLKSV